MSAAGYAPAAPISLMPLRPKDPDTLPKPRANTAAAGAVRPRDFGYDVVVMDNWEHFSKAPIVEALLDIQVTFASSVPVSRLEAFHETIRQAYPVKHERVQWLGEIQVQQRAVQQAVSRGPEGFMFRSRDDQRIVQVRQDGFTFNWLKPYRTWQALRDEARQHWGHYLDMFHPEAVTRLGLRYINRIQLPLPIEEFRDFVKTAPDVAVGLPQGLSAFFMRLEIPDDKRGLTAIVTETLEPPVDGGKLLPVIFDVDVVRSARFEPLGQAIWETFELMRDYKNEVFFASMTERARELFR